MQRRRGEPGTVASHKRRGVWSATVVRLHLARLVIRAGGTPCAAREPTHPIGQWPSISLRILSSRVVGLGTRILGWQASV